MPPCHSTSAGTSLVEVLVTLSIATTVLGVAMTVILSSRSFYETDQRRTDVNQNLRGALDLVGIDVRQTGARLPADFPAIELLDGADGAPDRLVVRWNLIAEVLPLCADIAAGGTGSEVRVAFSGGGGPMGCDPVADGDADLWPDNIQAWRDHRDAQGGEVAAYVFNPVDDVGEFFLYDGDGSDADWLHRAGADPWTNEYLVGEQCRIYLLEQRVYELDSDTLRFLVNADTANAINVAARIVDFQARAAMTDGTLQDAFGPADDRRDLQSIEITLLGQVTQGDEIETGEITARFFPRNILSL